MHCTVRRITTVMCGFVLASVPVISIPPFLWFAWRRSL